MANSTVDYYNASASQFYADTVGVDMSALRARFVEHIPQGGYILDAGCGSGRDSLSFLNQGFRVNAFDASTELAQLAAKLIDQHVAVRTFFQVDEVACYDGIWACASLLHLPERDISRALKHLWQALKPGGVLYVSFKVGECERLIGGRLFTDATQDRLNFWLSGLQEIESVDCWSTPDQRPNRTEAWLNALIHRQSCETKKLLTGEANHAFLPNLSTAIAQADEIDFAVSFIKTTGLSRRHWHRWDQATSR